MKAEVRRQKGKRSRDSPHRHFCPLPLIHPSSLILFDAHPSPQSQVPDPLFLLGLPGNVGGANTELWHTLKLWRRFGREVACIPTWRADPEWARRVRGIGCDVIVATPDSLSNVPSLRGATVVSFCNSRFLKVAPKLRRLGCRLVWVNCMTWLFPAERLHCLRHGPFDAYVFQSKYQQEQLQPQLARFGVPADRCFRVGAAFDTTEFPFAPFPRRPSDPLILGRLSRAAPDKFPADLWKPFATLRETGMDVRLRVMGFSDEIVEKTGPPPSWAECLPEGVEEPHVFLRTLHAIVQLSDTTENRPRTGLEAFSTGTPVVADARGGWKEMITHNRTGFLTHTHADLLPTLTRLAQDDPFRLHIARNARRSLERELAEPGKVMAGWEGVFGREAEVGRQKAEVPDEDIPE